MNDIAVDNIVHNAHRTMEARTSFVAGLFIGNARNKISAPRMLEKWKDWDIDWDKVINKVSEYQQLENPITEETRMFALEAINSYLSL